MIGRLFTFEGIDGSGKTTISHLVGKQLSDSYEVICTKEPTDSWIGKAVNRAVKEELDGVTVTLLFTADRHEHVSQIQSWLDEGCVVLCDRYIHSTLAYQSVSLSGVIDKPLAWIRTLHQPFFLEPTLTFLFVINEKIAIATFPGEPFIRHQLDWKANAEVEYPFFFGYTYSSGGSTPGYVADIRGAAYGGYGADSGSEYIEVGAGEAVMHRHQANLFRLKGLMRDEPLTKQQLLKLQSGK